MHYNKLPIYPKKKKEIQTDRKRYETEGDTDRQKEMQSDRRRYRQTEGATHRWKEIQTDRRRYRQTEENKTNRRQMRQKLH